MLKSIRNWALITVVWMVCAPILRAAVPDWVRQAAAKTQKVYSPKTNAVVLFSETQFTVDGPGKYVEHRRRVVRILRHEGRSEGHLAIGAGNGEKINSIHAWTVDSQKREYELREKDFREVGGYGELLYSDVHYLEAQAPVSEPGSVVAFEYEVQRRDWFNELDWNFEEDIPVEDAELVVALPSGWELKTSTTGPVDIQPARAVENRWQWSAHDLPGIEPEPLMPDMAALCARMVVAYFAPGVSNFNSVSSWDALGKWYADLTSSRTAATPEISSQAQQLVAGKNDFEGKLRALAAFVQSQIRYVAIEIGIGGFQPHSAADVFHARYGDCKDKVTLLSTMLEQVGIHSRYVLIDTTRDVVNPQIPSSLFDHAIIAIELPANVPANAYDSVITAKDGTRYIIFDPTDSYTPLGKLPTDLQNTYALLVTPGSGELFRTPLLSPGLNTVSRTGHFQLDPKGELSGEIVETRSGDHAAQWRYRLTKANEQERLRLFERHLSGSLQGFTLQKTDVQYLDQLNQNLVLTFNLTISQYGQVRGPLILVRPRVFGEESFSLENKPRQYPIELAGTSLETDTYEIEIPSTYKVDDLPGPVKIDATFATYQSKFEVEGTKLRYTREFVIRTPEVGPSQAAALRSFEETIAADEQANAVLLKAQ